MDGFKRPRQPGPPSRPVTPASSSPRVAPPSTPPRSPSSRPPAEVALDDVSLDIAQTPKKSPRKRLSRAKKLLIALGVCIALVLVATLGAFFWYNYSIQPRNTSDSSVIKVEVKSNTSLSSIADELQSRGVIRSALAFTLYARLNGQQSGLKAGTCNLKASESVQEILTKLTAGCHDFRVVTFYPGATLETSLYAKTHAADTGQEFVDFSIRQSLRTAGYDTSEIDAAFAATYDSPLFADKPAGTTLEGYIFGETYYVDEDASAKEVLQTAFDHMYQIVQQDGLIAKFKAQGLTLYQGITLASIVEKELDCEGKPTEDRKQRCYGYQQRIARVFYNRLADGMSLGSDVTFIYAADRLGVSPSVEVDSPYNTRIHSGLTPGPIASPGELALKAVANPATSNDLYFLAGDDGLIYFAQDEAGHQANIKNHCQESCGNAV